MEMFQMMRLVYKKILDVTLLTVSELFDAVIARIGPGSLAEAYMRLLIVSFRVLKLLE